MKANFPYPIIFLFILSFKSYGQGTISGSVFNAASKAPLLHANIVIKNKSGYANGAVSNENGQFKMMVPTGCYEVSITYVGLKSYQKDSICVEKDKVKNLGEIYLKPSNVLKGVEITGQSDAPDDRFIFVPSEILTGDGGSALEVFRNIPLVQVESNGKIKLRGSKGVQIWIDGRQSGLTGSAREAFLSNLPANSIERIEIITNPGASFDADGSSGIINIVMKKNALNGLRGSIGVNVGTKNKYGAFGRLDYATPKVMIGLNYSYRYNEFQRKYYSERINEQPFETQFNRLNGGKNYGGTHFSRLSFNYKPKEKWNIFADATFQYQYKTKERFLIQQQRFLLLDIWLSNQTRTGIEGESGITGDFAVGFNKTFNTKKHKLKAEVSYSLKPDTADRYYERNFLTQDYQTQTAPREHYQVFEKRKFHLFTSRVDYQLPLLKGLEIEIGAKSIYRTSNTNLLRYDEDPLYNQLFFNSQISNHFIYTEQIYAGYVELAHQIKKWKYKVGIRPEYSHIRVDQLTINQKNINKYFNYYPSASITFKPQKQHILRLSYSKRVNRPSKSEINPFPDYSDPLTVSYGNPYLKPEFTHSTEFLYTYDKNKFFITSALYYKYSTQVIGRFASLDPLTGITQNTYENLKDSHSAGVEFSIRTQMYKRWTLQGGLNLYYFKIDASNLESDLSQNNIGGQLKLMNSVRVWKNMVLQLSSTVLSPQVGPQKTTFWRYYFDFGVRKEFFKNRLSVTLSVTDFANTDRTLTNTQGSNFREYRNRKRESLIGMLTLIWRFGKNDNNGQIENIDLTPFDNNEE